MFEKGISGNPAGRPKGAVGEKTLEFESRARKLLTAIEGHKHFGQLIDHLPPKELATLYTRLLSFTEPKQGNVINNLGPTKVEIKQVFVIGGKEIEL